MHYETGKHTGWGHNSRGCRSCRETWRPADLRPDRHETRAPKRDELIGRDVIATHAYGFNANGGGRFRVENVRGQVWSQSDPTMIGSRRERAYWIADGTHFYVASAADILDQCEAEVPAMVTGGLTDVRCIEAPAEIREGVALCEECVELVS